MWARITRGAVAAAIVVGVASCDSGVFDHPGGDTGTDRGTTGGGSGSGSGGNTTTGSRNGGDRYGWFLPEGPDSPNFPEDDVYRRLVSWACAHMDGQWSSMTSPRAVLLHQAAVHLCRGDEPAGAARDDPRGHAEPTTATTTTNQRTTTTTTTTS